MLGFGVQFLGAWLFESVCCCLRVQAKVIVVPWSCCSLEFYWSNVSQFPQPSPPNMAANPIPDY